MKSTRAHVLRCMTELDEILNFIDLNPEGVAEQSASIAQSVADRMARLGHADLFEAVEPLTGYAAPASAKAYLSRCLAVLEPAEKRTEDGMLSLKEAAPLVGCTVSGLRKIVERTRAGKEPAIGFYQAVKSGPIFFRREWIDDYVAHNTVAPVVSGPRLAKKRNKHGLNWDLIE